MKTTTSDGGDADASLPVQTSEAVSVADEGAQVVTKDEHGTPTLAEPTSPAPSADEAVSEEPQAQEKETLAKAEPEPEDVKEWAKKANLPLDDPVKMAQMVRDTQRKMHEATEKARELETTAVTNAPLEYTGDPKVDNLNQAVNTLLIQNNVREFFNRNPEARDFESKMAEIVVERPHLQNDLDALYALARTDPSREAELKQAGGREALTNLAQKQQQIPPGASATNSQVYVSEAITPENVYDQIDRHDQAWFQKNYSAINKAISGK